MTYLTKEEIVAINHYQVAVFGGNFMQPNNFLHDLLINFTLSVASGESSLEQVQSWVEKHITTM